MATVNTDDLMTAKEVATAVAMPQSAASQMLKAIEPALKAGNTRLWNREDVKSYLYGMNEELLSFLGVRPEAESYDSNINYSDELSKEEV